MISSISHSIANYSTITRINRDIVDITPVSQVINVDRVNIEKDIVTTNIVNKEQINYIYNIQNRTIHQPINELGTIVNIFA